MSGYIIYTKTGCPYCRAAMEQFQKDGLQFREINVDKDREALKKCKEEYGASKVPVIVREGKLVEVGWRGGG